jgi:hypothetical protein
VRGLSQITELLAASVLAACSPAPPYASTAAKLARSQHIAHGVYFVKEWQPMGRSFPESLSADDVMRGKFWLDSCVSELTARFAPAPANTVRAIQIAECMAARGWRLDVREQSVAAALAARSVP